MKKCKTDNEYYREQAKLAINHTPDIYPCEKCGYPVIRGYGCTYCGDTNPSEEER